MTYMGPNHTSIGEVDKSATDDTSIRRRLPCGPANSSAWHLNPNDLENQRIEVSEEINENQQRSTEWRREKRKKWRTNTRRNTEVCRRIWKLKACCIWRCWWIQERFSRRLRKRSVRTVTATVTGIPVMEGEKFTPGEATIRSATLGRAGFYSWFLWREELQFERSIVALKRRTTPVPWTGHNAEITTFIAWKPPKHWNEVLNVNGRTYVSLFRQVAANGQIIKPFVVMVHRG